MPIPPPPPEEQVFGRRGAPPPPPPEEKIFGPQKFDWLNALTGGLTHPDAGWMDLLGGIRDVTLPDLPTVGRGIRAAGNPIEAAKLWLDILKGARAGSEEQFGKMLEAEQSGRMGEIPLRAMAGTIPMLGPAVATATENVAGVGPASQPRGVGQALGLAGSAILPKLLTRGGPMPVPRGAQALPDAAIDEIVNSIVGGADEPFQFRPGSAGAAMPPIHEEIGMPNPPGAKWRFDPEAPPATMQDLLRERALMAKLEAIPMPEPPTAPPKGLPRVAATPAETEAEVAQALAQKGKVHPSDVVVTKPPRTKRVATKMGSGGPDTDKLLADLTKLEEKVGAEAPAIRAPEAQPAVDQGRRGFLKKLGGAAAAAAIPGKAAPKVVEAAATAGKLDAAADWLLRSKKLFDPETGRPIPGAAEALGDPPKGVGIVERVLESSRYGEDDLAGAVHTLVEAGVSPKVAAHTFVENAAHYLEADDVASLRQALPDIVRMAKGELKPLELYDRMAKAVAAPTPELTSSPKPPQPAGAAEVIKPSAPAPSVAPKGAEVVPPNRGAVKAKGGTFEGTAKAERVAKAKVGAPAPPGGVGEPPQVGGGGGKLPPLPEVKTRGRVGQFIEDVVGSTIGGRGPIAKAKGKQFKQLEAHAEGLVKAVSPEADYAPPDVHRTLRSGGIHEVEALKSEVHPNTFRQGAAKLLRDDIFGKMQAPREGAVPEYNVARDVIKGKAAAKEPLAAKLEKRHGAVKLRAIYGDKGYESIKRVLDTADQIGHTPSSMLGSLANFYAYQGIYRASFGNPKALMGPAALHAAANVTARVMTNPWGARALENYLRVVGKGLPSKARGAKAIFWGNRLAEAAKKAGDKPIE